MSNRSSNAGNSCPMDFSSVQERTPQPRRAKHRKPYHAQKRSAEHAIQHQRSYSGDTTMTDPGSGSKTDGSTPLSSREEVIGNPGSGKTTVRAVSSNAGDLAIPDRTISMVTASRRVTSEGYGRGDRDSSATPARVLTYKAESDDCSTRGSTSVDFVTDPSWQCTTSEEAMAFYQPVYQTQRIWHGGTAIVEPEQSKHMKPISAQEQMQPCEVVDAEILTNESVSRGQQHLEQQRAYLVAQEAKELYCIDNPWTLCARGCGTQFPTFFDKYGMPISICGLCTWHAYIDLDTGLRQVVNLSEHAQVKLQEALQSLRQVTREAEEAKQSRDMWRLESERTMANYQAERAMYRGVAPGEYMSDMEQRGFGVNCD